MVSLGDIGSGLSTVGAGLSQGLLAGTQQIRAEEKQSALAQSKIRAEKELNMSKMESEQYSEGLKLGLGLVSEGQPEAGKLFLNKVFEKFGRPYRINNLEKQKENKWKATTADGAAFLYDENTGEVKTIQERGKAGDKGASASKLNTRENSFLKQMGSKYKAGGGLALTEDGRIDINALLTGDNPVFKEISSIASGRKKDPNISQQEAKNDLSDFNAILERRRSSLLGKRKSPSLQDITEQQQDVIKFDRTGKRVQ